jgi:predicted RNase H-like HicB family nuclease/uncharacterized protein (DUF1778 family)
MATFYPALVRKDAESSFGVEFPDFPGCISGGDTLDEAVRESAAALDLHVRGMVEDGEAIPEPSSADAVMAASDAVGGTLVLVPLKPPSKARVVRLNISLDQRLVEEIDAAAEARGMTRSGFLGYASRVVMDDGDPAALSMAGQALHHAEQIRRRRREGSLSDEGSLTAHQRRVQEFVDVLSDAPAVGARR